MINLKRHLVSPQDQRAAEFRDGVFRYVSDLINTSVRQSDASMSTDASNKPQAAKSLGVLPRADTARVGILKVT